MVKVMISNVTVHNNPAKFLSNYIFEIKFECLEQLTQELEFKLVYVGDAKEDKLDQVLDVVVIDAVAPGTYKFVFEAPPPDPKKLTNDSDVDVSVVLLLALYRNQEFARVGYYVFTEYDDPELRENPPVKVDFEKLNRNIAADEPRVTTYPIIWDDQQPTDQLVFAELTEEEKKLAEANDELEICQSLENVNCANETAADSSESKLPTESMESNVPIETVESVMPTETMESAIPAESNESKMPTETMESAIPTESSESKMPTETMESAIPTESSESKMPTETVESIIPVETMESNIPVEATEPNISVEKMEPSELKSSSEVMETTEQNLPTEPMESVEQKLPSEVMELTEEKVSNEPIESAAPTNSMD